MADSNTEPTPTTKPKEWKSLPPMSRQRYIAAGIWVNDHQFLMLGGKDENGTDLTSCEYYDKTTETWRDFPIDLPEPLTDFRVAVVGDRLFVMGGYIIANEARSDLISIDISGNDLATIAGNWKTLASMERGRYQFACVSDSQYIYVIGGTDGDASKPLKGAEKYDTETNQWTSLSDMYEGRIWCAAGMVGNKIYVVGGVDSLSGLASTIVFDTSEQIWETDSTVPDMKVPRAGLMIAVVDRFVIAFGGILEESIATIEVLDTQRNTWMIAPTPMKVSGTGFVAALLKETNDIIVAGGFHYDSRRIQNEAEIIAFENGILPPSFQFKERGQKVIGDLDHGKDELDVAIIAEALVEALLFLDLAPPFVLAILGKWGRGKSFFFNLMLEHMIRIQKKPAGLVRDTYAGHIYVVKFDAWTFSKGCLFSSFMYEILKTLNELLQFEEKVDKEALKAGLVSTIEVFRDLSTLEREYLEGNKEVWETYHNEAKKARENGEVASKRLLKAINRSYEDDKLEVEKIEMEIKEKIRTEQIKIHAKEKVRAAVVDIKRILNVLGKAALDKILEETPKENDGLFEVDVDTESERSHLLKKSSIELKNIDDCKKLIKDIKEMKIRWYHTIQVSNISHPAMIISLLIALFAIFLFLQFREDVVGIVTGLLSGCLSLVIPVMTSISTAVNKINPIIKELKTIDSLSEVEDPESRKFDDKDIKELEKKLEKKKSEIENRTLALEGQSLRDFVKTIDSTQYVHNLGIVHKVQQDLKLLSDGMLNPRQQKDIFPRGAPRIVLFVDDLDRCEKDNVVEVIEALQLLVKTKLFVAVLAIDPRYVTTSIENHYKGILDPQTPPSGMDYLEKIIQIPFRLPGVGQDSIDAFVDSQIEIEESQATATETDTEAQDSIPASDSTDSISNLSTGPQQRDQGLAPKTDTAKDTNDEALPRDKVFFTRDEADMMKKVFKLFGVGPRCIRRVINVFKVLQVIWKRSGSKFEVNLNLKRATLFLMLMASDESTRDVTYKIFDWMDSGRVMYHNVALDGDDDNNLANLFKKEMRARDKSFELSFSGDETKEGTLIAFLENYLSEYKWTNFEGWNRISSQMLLARCFSFYRVTSEEDDENQE